MLIIGILAAVALPQYQKAVERSRITEALIIGKALRDAQERYYLAAGNYASSWDDLDIELPGTRVSNTEFVAGKYQFRLDVITAPHIFARQPGKTSADSDYWFDFWFHNINNDTLRDNIYCSTRPGFQKGDAICATFGGKTNDYVTGNPNWGYLDTYKVN